MAKCTRCGKKGLFLRVDSDGMCPRCQPIFQCEKQLRELDDQLSQAERDLNDKEGLLRNAKEAAKDEAFRQLEAESSRLRSDISTSITISAHKQEECARIDDELEAVEKKLKSAQNRLAKAVPLYNSMKHAMDNFMTLDMEKSLLRHDFDIHDISSVVPPVVLNCLSMKSLRTLYRQNEQRIKDTYESYSGRYTTKANATIYKLMVLALEAELRNILQAMKFGNLDSAVELVKTLTAKYYTIATEGNQSIAPIMQKFIGQIESLYIDSVKIEYEFYIQRERAKEEQRALKDQMRQEAEERKQLEAERKQIENEEKKYHQEMDRITAQLATAHQTEVGKLTARLAELEKQLTAVADKKEEIINLQNGKAGTVYIISNIGAFGDHTFKIGMTRRSDPQVRVNELGDASVPFPFDVHSFIFSQDAVSLENALHRELNDRRVNKINLRKEFFNVPVDELQGLVERIDPTAPFQETALAEQYRQSISMASTPAYDRQNEDVDLEDDAV